MKLGGFVVVAALVGFMVWGTLSDMAYIGPWFLQWLDIKWWWHWIAVGWVWVDSYVDIDFHVPDGSSGGEW